MAVEESSLRLRENWKAKVDLLFIIYYGRYVHLPVTMSPRTMRNIFVWRGPASLNNFMVALLLRPGNH